jgi:hypothetical protein
MLIRWGVAPVWLAIRPMTVSMIDLVRESGEALPLIPTILGMSFSWNKGARGGRAKAEPVGDA